MLNVKILIVLMLFLEQARGRRTWPLRATWCPRAPPWWPLVCLSEFVFSCCCINLMPTNAVLSVSGHVDPSCRLKIVHAVSQQQQHPISVELLMARFPRYSSIMFSPYRYVTFEINSQGESVMRSRSRETAITLMFNKSYTYVNKAVANAVRLRMQISNLLRCFKVGESDKSIGATAKNSLWWWGTIACSSMCANQGCGAEARAWNFASGSIALICEASELPKHKVFQFSLDEISFELEPQTLDAWSRSLKFEFRLRSPCANSANHNCSFLTLEFRPTSRES